MEKHEVTKEGNYLDNEGNWRNKAGLLINESGEVILEDSGNRKAYVEIDSDNNVLGWGSTYIDGAIELKYNEKNELPDVLNRPFLYKYKNKKFVEIEGKKEELKKSYEHSVNEPTESTILTNMLGRSDGYEKDKVACQVKKAITFLTENLDEEQAVQVPDLFEEWQPGKNYVIGKRLKYGVDENGVTQLYEVAQDHTSQENWVPSEVTSLYKKIGVTDTGYDIWTQPYGYADPYMIGKIISHNGQLYISSVDNNVWEPGVHGWNLYEG